MDHQCPMCLGEGFEIVKRDSQRIVYGKGPCRACIGGVVDDEALEDFLEKEAARAS